MNDKVHVHDLVRLAAIRAPLAARRLRGEDLTDDEREALIELDQLLEEATYGKPQETEASVLVKTLKSYLNEVDEE